MQLITEERGGDRTVKNNYSVLLRNGVVPDVLKEHFEKLQKTRDNQPLSFDEITRFNTWFEIHPEKIAGKEVITTSREFPVSIKGYKSDILATIGKTLKQENRLRVAKAKFEAKLKLLQLMKI